MFKYQTKCAELEDMVITKEELIEGTCQIHLEGIRTPSRCPKWNQMTSKVRDDRL